MAGPYTGTGWYNPIRGYCNSRIPLPPENEAGGMFSGEVRT